ncbi:hypothetical protein PAXRUDRAFT_177733 [Paxillus rubicundulus Ve08.2h10]|uniref:DDE-1 domain-containing protein n=1 Tax=Paxillus rubicundulus Ve08.2h10 TaxID=930991 RepID=A0A0D0CDP6_9AGAM|nr:hypothetical protein PAXRUDRAFT_177733 [Paxillus rubicundulus Ve08.2h10]
MKFIFWTENTEHYCLHCDNLELVSILECINAAGTTMPPCFLTNINYLTRIAMSPNGWTNQVLCEEWFRDTFVPNTLACCVNEKPIVLNVDRHDSHETDNLKAIAYEYDIIIIRFPSKMTHKTQPLDIGIFSSVS